jgi:hypothetical protein
MSNGTPLTESEVKQFVDVWYQKLDVHAPAEELLPMLADEELVMRLPEVTEHGHQGFIHWYERVIRTFFDEVHTLEAVSITILPSGDTAEVKLVLKWEPLTWNPPDAKSKRLGFFAAQTWMLQRSSQTQKPVMVTYNVDYFIPVPGSANL